MFGAALVVHATSTTSYTPPYIQYTMYTDCHGMSRGPIFKGNGSPLPPGKREKSSSIELLKCPYNGGYYCHCCGDLAWVFYNVINWLEPHQVLYMHLHTHKWNIAGFGLPVVMHLDWFEHSFANLICIGTPAQLKPIPHIMCSSITRDAAACTFTYPPKFQQHAVLINLHVYTCPCIGT